MDTRGYRYLFWTAALAAGCLAWLVVLGLIGISSSLDCDAPGCRTGEDYAWLGAVLSWLLGSLAMIALVAVGWVAGRRGAPVRRRWFIAATVALLGILVLGVTSLAVLPDGHSDQRSGAQRDG